MDIFESVRSESGLDQSPSGSVSVASASLCSLAESLAEGGSILRYNVRFSEPNSAMRELRNRPLQTGRVTNIIITSLSYTGMYRAQDQSPLKLQGTKFDIALLLRHFDYCHEGNSVDFTLLHDFDVEFTDSTGVNRVIPKVDTSRDSIMRIIQSIMRAAQPHDKIVFYFGGHGEHAEVNMMGGDSGDECDFQTMLAGDGRRIYGKELRAWFCETRYPSVSVTVVVDAGHSGGSLGLPYNYYARGKSVELEKVADIRVPIPMVQISATQPNQVAWSNAYNDGYYSQLAHSLVEYLKGTENPTIEGLVDHLSKKCDPSGAQLPQVSCSREIKGRVSLF